MKSIFTTTITGPDQPELIRNLAEKTRAHGGEWLVTKLIKLDGRLAAIMRVTIDRDREQELKENLEQAFPEVNFTYGAAVTERQSPGKTVMLEIDFLDRPGLTKDLSDLLIKLDTTLENLESTRHPIGTVSSTAYSTRVTLTTPVGIESSVIANEIEGLSNQVRVTVFHD